MSSIVFRCEICSTGCTSYKNWLLHLTSKPHQSNIQQNQDLAEIELSRHDNRNKSIMVNRIGCSIPLMNVAVYFSKLGAVLKNFIYRGEEEVDYDYSAADNQGLSTPTMHCILVFESENHVLQVLKKRHHEIDGHLIHVKKLYSSGSSPEGSVYEYPVSNEYQNYGQSPDEIEYEQTGTTVVKMDLKEFETEKQKSVFENINEYQQIGGQMKDDLADLKLEEQVDSFCQLLCLTSEKLQKRIAIGTELLNILQTGFPKCAIYSFGLDCLSVSSDIDPMSVVVDPLGKMNENQDCQEGIQKIVPENQSLLAPKVFELLKTEQYHLRFCKDVEMKWVNWALSDASQVRKISFVHRETGILCNLIIENFMIVQESRLLRFLSSLDPRVHSLICFVQFFGSVHNTLQSPDECFRNQSIIWLMICFLSSRNIIPTVHKLLSLSSTVLIIDDTDVSFCIDKEVIKHQKAPFMDDTSIRCLSTLSLLREFFHLMSTANLKQNVVCPIIGKLVPVNAFGRTIGDDFPEEIRERYLWNADSTPKTKRFFSGSPMGLQDPLDLTANITENVSFLEVTRFQGLCSQAAQNLEEILQSGTGDVMTIFTESDIKQVISVGDKIFIPMESQTEPSESEESDDEEPAKEIPMIIEEEEDSPFELDRESDDSDDEDAYQEDIRKSRIRASQSLLKFFEKAINQSMAQYKEEDRLSPLELRRKFQVLWLQYLIEFNSRFWSKCFGFTVDAASDQKVTPEEYSQTGELLASLSLKEIFDLIKTEDSGYGLDFRCELVEHISDLIYKKKLWKKKYLLSQIRPLWMVLTGKATSKLKTKDSDAEIQNVLKMVKIPYQNRLEFSCKLDVTFDMRDEVPANGSIGTNAKLSVSDESYGRGKGNRALKLRFLVVVYEKLAMKYINLRVKQWLAYCCKELEYPKFDAEFKKWQKKRKGHPKWKKFRRKWKLQQQERS